MTLEALLPHPVWGFFNDLLAIPRGSGKEQQVQNWIKAFAERNGFWCEQDSVGNLRVNKGTSPDIILQAHTDMVQVKDTGSTHNFDTDPIQAYIDGDFVKARGTTLGADNGIGVAMALAALQDRSIGTLSALFTVNEETGLTGVRSMDPRLAYGRTLINLDSEAWGQLFIGCVGARETTGVFSFTPASPTRTEWYTLQIDGFQGGHSGTDIHKPHDNPIKLLAQILSGRDYEIARIDGGVSRSAIPMEASAVIGLDSRQKEELTQVMRSYLREDSPARLNLSPAQERPEYCIPGDVAASVVAALGSIHHGVIARNLRRPQDINYSNNLARVQTADGNVEVLTMQRGSEPENLGIVSAGLRDVLERHGASVTVSEGYSGWTSPADSRVLRVTEDAYSWLFGHKPKAGGVHAGLECGVIAGYNPELDVISFGPTIYNPHSPSERVQISTVDPCYILVRETVCRLGQMQ